MSKSITAKELGKILFDEFERDAWGEVNPFYFSDPPKVDEKGVEGMAGLYEVLERAADKLNSRFGAS